MTETKTLNTMRSVAKAQEFQQTGRKLKRKIQTYEKHFSHPAEDVFYQFCPTRELDWIDGWDCELVYTTTGYVEKDCIFTTAADNYIGPGLWIFTNYVPNERLELVRILGNDVVIHFRIHLRDNGDATSTGVWHLTFTALNEQGNQVVDNLPERIQELEQAIDGLEYFLTEGELMRNVA
ncbi:MAG: hypothetical protein D6E12_00885 [Desulfovibrio sp.]|nr:MAG: hypothetical protein D6E12_00885 [Desulfovibrio sp.]